METLKINIVGDGSAGQRHARMLRERGHVCTVLGPNTASPVTHPTCDAVVIASPPDTHKLYLSWYHDKCPMLCEGPITWMPPFDAYPHMVASNWLFVPQIRALKQQVEDKQPTYAILWFDYDLTKWRPTVDYRTTCYYTSGIDEINHHEVTTALHLFGSAIRVSVEHGHTGKSLGVDYLSMLIRHSNSVCTSICSGWQAAHYTRGIKVMFTDGTSTELGWTSPNDDAVCNTSYSYMIDHWLRAIEREDCGVMPSLQMGYEAWNLLHGRTL